MHMLIQISLNLQFLLLPNNQTDDTSYEEFSSSNVPVQANHKSVSRDSGIDNTSSLSIDIKEEECEEQTTSEKGREEQTWRKFEASVCVVQNTDSNPFLTDLT